jgi:hypothetical protein
VPGKKTTLRLHFKSDVKGTIYCAATAKSVMEGLSLSSLVNIESFEAGATGVVNIIKYFVTIKTKDLFLT